MSESSSMMNELHEKYNLSVEKSKSQSMSTKKRMVKTICMSLSMVGVGLGMVILGPTLLDLSKQMNVDMAELSRGPAASSAGTLALALVGGLLCDRFRAHGDLIIAVGSLLCGLGLVFVPWTPHLSVFYILMAITGAGSGLLRVGIFTFLQAMWREKSSGAVHLAYAGLTVGLMLSPVVAGPFLAPVADNIHLDLPDAGNTTSTSSEDGSLCAAYAIVGVFNIIMAIPYIVFQITDRRGYVTPESVMSMVTPRHGGRLATLKKLISPTSYRPDKPLFGVCFLTVDLLAYCLQFLYVAPVNLFLFTFSVEEVGVSKAMTSRLLPVLYTLEILSRLLVSVLSYFVSIQVIFMVEIAGSLLFSLMLALFGLLGPWHYWGLLYANQLFFGPLMASVHAWTNAYVEYTGLVSSLFQIVAGIGLGLGSPISGRLNQAYGGQMVLYFMLGCIAALAAVCLPLQVVAHRAGVRFNTNKREDEEDSSKTMNTDSLEVEQFVGDEHSHIK